MTQNQILAKKNDLFRKSGSVSLFLFASPIGFAAQPYTRFRVCRGFIDDLNRMLSIRMRIHIEVEIGRGRVGGEVESSQFRFRWEFRED